MLAILDADKSVVLKLSNLTTQHPVWKSHPKDVSRGLLYVSIDRSHT